MLGRSLFLLVLALLMGQGTGCYDGCPQTKAEFCGARNCGVVTEANQCGEVQSIACGECFGPDICGGGGVANVCAFCKHPTVKEDCVGGWCKIPAGCFNMGSNSMCTNGVVTNPPPDVIFGVETQHQVALTHPFEIMDAEVIQQRFRDLMGYLPSRNNNQPNSFMPNHPAEYVSWHEAAAYANALSDTLGYERCYDCSGDQQLAECDARERFQGSAIYRCSGYRLPTEAEWEYAARAGTETDLFTGHDLTGSTKKPDDTDAGLEECMCKPENSPADWNWCDQVPFYSDLFQVAWFLGNAEQHHHPVRTQDKNPWGLYDTAGNVFEWCHDWADKDMPAVKATDPAGKLSGTLRAVRSGAYEWGQTQFFRVSTRRLEKPAHVCHSVGFRLARTLTQ